MDRVVDRWSFYLDHAVRGLRREKQRTAFALFCLAVGVATIVALQTLGFVIADAMTGNAQAGNRGDVALIQEADDFFTADQMAAFDRLVVEGMATDVTYRYRTQELHVALVHGEGDGRGIVLDSFLVDPVVYPFYAQVRALEPPRVPLAQLLTDPGGVVIGKSLADRSHLVVGDSLQIGQSLQRLLRASGPCPASEIVQLCNGSVYDVLVFAQSTACSFCDLEAVRRTARNKDPQLTVRLCALSDDHWLAVWNLHLCR